jgi:hypothetical protein
MLTVQQTLELWGKLALHLVEDTLKVKLPVVTVDRNQLPVGMVLLVAMLVVLVVVLVVMLVVMESKQPQSKIFTTV